MKSKYRKPNILIEHFSLTQSVATACGAAHYNHLTGGPNHWSKTTCGWMDSYGESFWLDSANNCGNVVDTEFSLEGLCYNNPSAEYAIFGS